MYLFQEVHSAGGVGGWLVEKWSIPKVMQNGTVNTKHLDMYGKTIIQITGYQCKNL